MSNDNQITSNTAGSREWRGIHTQVNRQQWESQWMAQLSTTVVEHDTKDAQRSANEGGTQRTASANSRVELSQDQTKQVRAGMGASETTRPLEKHPLAESHGARPRAYSHPAMSHAQPMQAGTPGFTASAHGPAATNTAHASGAPVLAATDQTAHGTVHTVDATMQTSSATVQSYSLGNSAPRLTASTVPPSFAIWKDGDSVRFAMRAREPEQAGEIISTLRTWLRAVGLTLRDVWINGRNHHGG